MNYIHTTVMLNETLDLLKPKNKNEILIDGTAGEGGFSYHYLEKYPDTRLICIDADKEILNIAKKRLAVFGNRVQFFEGFSYDFFADYNPDEQPDAILFDLGISLFHYKESGRGFSFEKDEYLDMRINQKQDVTAADLIAKLSEKDLADVLYYNADERYSRRIAKKIVTERKKGPVTTTGALANLIEAAVPASYRHRPIHAATKTFYALRCEINGELSKLPNLLEAALKVLRPGGRLAVISFNSKEDKIVKDFFRLMSKDCTCPENVPICKCEGKKVNILTKKGITAAQDEVRRNPPSRSARLRVCEKVLKEGGI